MSYVFSKALQHSDDDKEKRTSVPHKWQTVAPPVNARPKVPPPVARKPSTGAPPAQGTSTAQPPKAFRKTSLPARMHSVDDFGTGPKMGGAFARLQANLEKPDDGEKGSALYSEVYDAYRVKKALKEHGCLPKDIQQDSRVRKYSFDKAPPVVLPKPRRPSADSKRDVFARNRSLTSPTTPTTSYFADDDIFHKDTRSPSLEGTKEEVTIQHTTDDTPSALESSIAEANSSMTSQSQPPSSPKSPFGNHEEIKKLESSHEVKVMKEEIIKEKHQQIESQRKLSETIDELESISFDELNHQPLVEEPEKEKAEEEEEEEENVFEEDSSIATSERQDDKGEAVAETKVEQVENTDVQVETANEEKVVQVETNVENVVLAETNDEKVVQAETNDENVVQVETNEEKVEQAETTVEEKVVQVETNVEKVVQVETNVENVVQAESADEEVVQAETNDEKVVQVETNEEKVVQAENADEEKVVQVETNDEKVVQVDTNVEKVVKAENVDEEKVVQVETNDEKVVQVKTNVENVVQAESADEEKVVQVVSNDEKVVQVESNDEKVVQVESNDDKNVQLEKTNENVVQVQVDTEAENKTQINNEICENEKEVTIATSDSAEKNIIEPNTEKDQTENSDQDSCDKNDVVKLGEPVESNDDHSEESPTVENSGDNAQSTVENSGDNAQATVENSGDNAQAIIENSEDNTQESVENKNIDALALSSESESKEIVNENVTIDNVPEILITHEQSEQKLEISLDKNIDESVEQEVSQEENNSYDKSVSDEKQLDSSPVVSPTEKSKIPEIKPEIVDVTQETISKQPELNNNSEANKNPIETAL